MIILKENDENWFVLKGAFNSMGLNYADLIEINRLISEKLVQIKNRHK